jgi:hypothetical protein
VAISLNREPELISAVKNNFENSSYYKYVSKIFEIFKDYPIFLWGGAVRGPIVRQKYGRNGETKDFDIIIDDSENVVDLQKRMSGLTDVYFNRFEVPKWRPSDGLEIDVSRFSNASRLRNGESLPVSLSTTLESCDFTTSAIAYQVGSNKIYGNGALEGIEKKEIDLVYSQGDEPHILMCRAMLHKEKLGFGLGPKIKQFIQDNYSVETNEHIKRYLQYKQLQDKYDLVVGKLTEQ